MKNFKQLIASIEETHLHLQASAANAVNQALTIRNWLIGYYIVEFEQEGNDRAEYGARLLECIAEKIAIKGLTAPELSRCRQFYSVYPQILGTLSQKFTHQLSDPILGTLSQKLEKTLTQRIAQDVDRAAPSVFKPDLQTPPEKILTKLSFSHLIELIKITEPLKRTFYELECIKGTWSVRELKRQISSLYFERSGLSENPDALSALVNEKTLPLNPKDVIKNIYAFEFLDIPAKAIIEESDLESALLDHLQDFILELGNGFCLEARQKRILIGENYYFIDLVFYHRILKCHILLDLKMGAFEHYDIGQLNTYLHFFKHEISDSTDNPPVGILLVASKDHALVKYATAGMDENLFVQEYLIRLPSKEQLEKYIENELRKSDFNR